MILMEVAYKNEELEYLEEYLIRKPTLTITEARKLIFIIEEDKEAVIKQLKGKAKKNLDSLKAWFEGRVKYLKEKYEGATLVKYLKKLKETYKNKRLAIINSLELKTGMAIKRFDKMKTSVKVAWKTVPKKGKIGAAVAGGLAAGTGLAAYAANKKRKESLAAK